jgi:hypothetical protein
MIKALSLIILLCTTPLLHAEEKETNSVTLFDHGDYIIEMALKKEKGWDELLAYFVSCRLDEICMMQSLRQSVSFGSESNLIKDAYSKYAENQTKIYQHYQNCRLRDIVKVKEALSMCYAKLLEDDVRKMPVNEQLQITARCLELKLLTLSERDNVFALRSLVDLYTETGKTDNAQIWQKVLDGQVDNKNLSYIEACIEDMHIFDK